MIPIDIQMQIDLSAQDAHRAIAEGFAKLRASLPPAPYRFGMPDARLQAALMNAAQEYMARQDLPGDLCPTNPFEPNFHAMQNAGMASGAYDGCLGVLGGLFTGAAALREGREGAAATSWSAHRSRLRT